MQQERPKYLKKFMKLCYLEACLTEAKLHLADPGVWPDQNDHAAVQLAGYKSPRVTCLNSGPDRHHMWENYADSGKGACLWFCARKMIAYLDEQSQLESGYITYLSVAGISRIDSSKIQKPAFIKRSQYRDEKEFRVVLPNSRDDKLPFPINCLKKIVLGPSLTSTEATNQKRKLSKILNDCSYAGVEILQNRSHNYSRWQEELSRRFNVAQQKP